LVPRVRIPEQRSRIQEDDVARISSRPRIVPRPMLESLARVRFVRNAGIGSRRMPHPGRTAGLGKLQRTTRAVTKGSFGRKADLRRRSMASGAKPRKLTFATCRCGAGRERLDRREPDLLCGREEPIGKDWSCHSASLPQSGRFLCNGADRNAATSAIIAVAVARSAKPYPTQVGSPLRHGIDFR
jgi:hypothetical protein